MTLFAGIDLNENCTDFHGLTEGQLVREYNERAEECSRETEQEIPLANNIEEAKKLFEEYFGIRVVTEVICEEVDGLIKRAVEQNLTWNGVTTGNQPFKIRPLLILDTDYLIQISIRSSVYVEHISKYHFSLLGLQALPLVLLSRGLDKVKYLEF